MWRESYVALIGSLCGCCQGGRYIPAAASERYGEGRYLPVATKEAGKQISHKRDPKGTHGCHMCHEPPPKVRTAVTCVMNRPQRYARLSHVSSRATYPCLHPPWHSECLETADTCVSVRTPACTLRCCSGAFPVAMALNLDC